MSNKAAIMGFSVILTRLILASMLAATATSKSLPGCPDKCGNVSIPYPFGTKESCYLNEDFKITCDSSFSPPIPFSKDNVQVTNILVEGQLQILQSAGRDCYYQNGSNEINLQANLSLSKFTISATANKFAAVGCDTIAIIEGYTYTDEDMFMTGCISVCDKIENINGSCSGGGCCELTVPKGLKNITVSLDSIANHTEIWDFDPCSYFFMVERDEFNFSTDYLTNLQKEVSLPMTIDWEIGNGTCVEAKKNESAYVCKGNSTCYEPDNSFGYRCKCFEGYQGNPYHPDGCQDIDECTVSNPCNSTCHNSQGSFLCSCPKGYEGDGMRNGTGCSPIHKDQSEKFSVLITALAICSGLIVLLVVGGWLYLVLKKRKLIKLKQIYFQQNGGLMLQGRLSGREGSTDAAKIYTAEELKKATNNYEEGRIVGTGGFGVVYKGILQDNTIVAIKKSKIVDRNQIEQFINEVVVLSQINHRNVVKLLGCCLDTEVPLLVYEFISNGTLYDHIHKKSNISPLSWETRLRIAAETAGVLSYLHSAASTPIIHRDVKSTNILLDQNYTAKVSDFGTSRLVPLDQTQLSTMVQGTLGYLDPEYLLTSQLTEKSDVYSFGVVLVELLTGKKALSFDRPEEERSLAMHFLLALKEDRLFQNLEECIVSEGCTEQLQEVASLVKRCLKLKGDERPTMKEVAMELEGMRVMAKHPWINNEPYTEEANFLLDEPTIVTDYDQNGSVGCDTIKNHLFQSPRYGR